MKKALMRFLGIAAVLALVSCSAEEAVPSVQEEAVSYAAGETGLSRQPDAEILRAISLGLVPEEIQGEYHTTITFRQYTELLGNLIAAWDPGLLPQWEAVSAKASDSDETMRREDGILEMAYAMELVGMDAPTEQGQWRADLVMEQIDRSGVALSWDYPLFLSWEDTAFSWNQANYMWGGLILCAVNPSLSSGEAVYPFEPEDGDTGYLLQPLSRRDAIAAALRFGELRTDVLEPEGEYRALEEAGKYDETILTPELLNASSNLPPVTQATLPDSWKGAGISVPKNGDGLPRDFQEEDIKFLADNGFNFARIFFGFSTLRFPDYPDSPRMVNVNELRDLDQLIAWGVKYGVHIQLSMSFYLDADGNEKLDGSIAASEAEWELAEDYWEMLARRYAGIDSNFLTFDLANEIQPDESAVEEAAVHLQKVVDAVRRADSGRVLLYSFPGYPVSGWMEAVAGMGVAIGCHPYDPPYLTASDYVYADDNPYAEPVWPLPWLPMGQIANGEAPLALEGEIGGTRLTVYVRSSSETPVLAFYADGALFASVPVTGGKQGADGEYFYHQTAFEAIVPEGAGQVEVWVQNGYARVDTLVVEGKAGRTVIMPHDACGYLDDSAPLPLTVQADGSHQSGDGRVVDGDAVYDTLIRPYQAVAEQNGVGFMVNEFGIFATGVGWDVSVVAAYHDSMLQMLEEQGLSWCVCELYNGVPKHMVLIDGASSQWAGATEAAVEVRTENGEKTYRVVKELLDIFRKYAVK